MNCGYCQYGWTRGPLRDRGHGAGWPSAQAVEAALDARLAAAAGDNERIDRITIAGHGEPTLHPAFADIMERLCRVRDRVSPSVPIAVLSNSTTAGAPDVQRGLARADERHMKIDAGDPFTCAQINGRAPSLADTTHALRTLAPIVVQAMFVSDETGEIDNTSDAAVDRWLTVVDAIRAERVHIYTI